MLHNNEIYKKRIEELLPSKLIDRSQFDKYYADNIIYHSLKITTVAADIVVTGLDLAATAASFGATA
jgi:HD superfamily phosphodiesterase